MTDVASAVSSVDSGTGGLLAQMRKNDKESDDANKGYIKKIEDTKLPAAPTLTPAPEPQQSDPLNGFGSAATWLATFGSMLTRRPLTNALNATADVMDAHKAQDATNFKQKWDKWKTETDNAWKMTEYNQELYKDALGKTEAEQKITASSTKNRTLEMAIQAKMQEAYHKDMIRQVKQGGESKKYLENYVDKEAKKLMDQGMDVDEAHVKALSKILAEKKAGGSDEDTSKQYEEWKKTPRAKLISEAIAKGAPPASYIRGRGKDAEKQLEFAQDYAKELHPDLDLAEAMEDYKSASKAVSAFGSGKQGDIVRSFNVAYNHADLVSELATALGNGDVKKINEMSQAYEEEFGSAAPTNFDAAKTILADEINKAAVGGAGALADREKISNTILRSESPAQFSGALDTYKGLIVGQMSGMKKQYEQATKRKDFDKLLAPDVESDLQKYEKKHSKGGGTVPSEADIAHLRKYPSSKASFDKHFGQGASAKVLGE